MPKIKRTPPKTHPHKSEEVNRETAGNLDTNSRKQRRNDDSDSECSHDARRSKVNCCSENLLTEALSKFQDELKSIHTTIQSLKNDQDSRFSKIHTELVSLKSQIGDLQCTNKDIEKSLDFISGQYENLQIRTRDLESVSKDQNSKIIQLESRIEELYRQSYSSKIEIRNVGAKAAETENDVIQYVRNLFTTLNIKETLSDVRGIRRMNGRIERKPILVELSSSSSQQKVMKAVKKYNAENKKNKLNSTHLGIPGAASAVYVADYLTPKARKLFYLAREYGKKHGYRYVWTSSGKIYIRKDDGAEFIHITEEFQLDGQRSP